MKILYIICLLFCFYSIEILVNDSYKVIYIIKPKDDDLRKTHKFSTCLSINLILSNKKFYKNKTEVDFERLVADLSAEIGKFLTSISDDFLKNDSNDTINAIQKSIKSRQFYFHNFHFCVVFDRDATVLFHFRHEINRNYYKHFIFKNDPNLFFSDAIPDQSVFLLKIVLLPSPYSNCSRYDKNGNAYSYFRCVNDCLKKNKRSLKYFYNANESTGLVDLSFKSSYISEDEKICFEKDECFYLDCELNFRIARSIPSNGGLLLLTNSKTIEANKSLENYEFYFQFLGLICLLMKISVYQIISKIIDYCSLKSNSNERYKKKLAKLKYTILILSIISTLTIGLKLIFNYFHSEINPLSVETTSFDQELKPFFLIFCIKISKIIDTEDDPLDLFGDDLLDRITFQQLINKTEGYDNQIEQIYLDFAGKKQKIKWNATPKVIFKADNRCFQIKLKLELFRYQSLLSIAKIVIKLKDYRNFQYFYLVPEEENYDKKAHPFGNSCSIRKQVIKRSNKKIKCIDYKLSDLNCTSQAHCIEKCIGENFLETHSSILLSSAYTLDIDNLKDKNFDKPINRSEDKNIPVNCNIKYPDLDCTETYLKCLNKLDNGWNEKITLDLFYEIVVEEESKSSIYKLLIDLLNIEGVFLGFSVFHLYLLIIKFLKSSEKTVKICSIIGRFLCLIAFTYHIYHIFDEVLNGKLIYNQYFQALDTIQMPEIGFCFDIDEQLIDKNYELNARYLQTITKKIEPNTIFKWLLYKNKTKDTVTLSSNFDQTDDFEFKNFYLNNRKCIILEYKQTFLKRDFYYAQDASFLKILFAKFVSKQQNGFIFFTKLKSTYQFSKFIHFDPIYLLDKEASIKTKLYDIRLNDKFTFLKNPLTFFHSQDCNDVTAHLTKMSNTFKTNYKFATKILPLESNFDFQINDALFEQFNYQIQNKSDLCECKRQNFQRTFMLNDIESTKGYKNFMITFYPTFYIKKLEISNENSYPKLIINLLNSLSIWFDFSVLEFYLYFNKIEQFCIFLYNHLNKLKLIVNPFD